MSGYAYDESAVPLLAMNVSGPGTINCLDAVSIDGQWSWVLDATGQADGTLLILSLQATDIFGQASTATPPQSLIVDAVPPVATINLTDNQIVDRRSACGLQ